MSTKYTHLFSPIKVGGTELPNRIAMMPMGVFSPRLLDPKTGAYTKDGADYYIERAKGGTGLIVTGVVPIIPMPGKNPVNFPDEYIEKMRYLTEGVHKYGSKIFIQFTAMTGRAAHITNEIEWKMLPAPAPIQNVWDEYGGSLENRLRFAKEIVEAIKAKCGKEFPVSVRYSVRSYVKDFNRGALPWEEFEEKGRDLAEGIQVAKMLESFGYDMLDCDNGSYDSWFWPHPPMYMPKACNLKDVQEVKKAVNIPVVCAGRFDDPELAEQAIEEGKIDIMGMGRPLLADPELGHKFYEGRLEDVRPCISCHQGCLGRIFQGKDISCAVNPACGREKSYALTEAEKKKKVLVIGGGLGGMEAARVCALRGHEVDLYEKTDHLGGVFVAAATPDFKEDDRHLLAWYKKQMKDLPIQVHMNTEVTEDMTKGYDEIFVAIGAKERKLEIPGFESPHVTYAFETLRDGSIQIDGENVLIIGGGLTGCEIAYMFAREGKKVTIVEMTETILNAFGLSAANYNMLMEILDYYKVKVIKNAVVEEFRDGKAIVAETVKNYPNVANRAKLMFALGPQGMKVKHEIPADHIVVSVGYLPDDRLYEQIKGDHVYLIGDAKRPTNVMDAIWAAYEIAKDI